MDRQPIQDWQTICDCIYNNPTEWQAGQYTFSHKPSGLSIWISNTVFDIKPYQSAIQFKVGIRGKLKIWTAYRWWLAWNLDQKLNQKRLPEARDNG